MSAAVAMPVADSVPLRRWSTPTVLWRFQWALWICDLLLLGAFLYAGHVHRDALQQVGRGSAPRIIAALALKSSLADMDADAARELLQSPAGYSEVEKLFHTRRRQAANALLQLAQDTASGAIQRLTILRIELNLSKYEELLQHARDLQQENNPGFVAAYNSAAQVLDSSVLPDADALDQYNRQDLESAYWQEHATATRARGLVAAASLALSGLLVMLQLYLFQRTNRVFNVPLLTASVLLFLVIAGSLQSFNAAESDLKRAKEDAFTSIHALWRTWALAYQMKSGESRLLLDPQHSEQVHASLLEEQQHIAKLEPDDTFEAAAQSSPPARFSGYLAAEWNNVTFPGEREAAADVLRAYGHFEGAVRVLEASESRHGKILVPSTSMNTGDVDRAFDEFSRALEHTLQINQKEFNSAVADGFAQIENVNVKAAGLAGIVGLLSFLGVMQRIREYK